MNLKNRVKTYAFWVALSSAVVVLIQSLGKLFGFEIESTTIENVIMSICGVLIVLGIVTNSTDKSNESDGSGFDEISNTDTLENSQITQVGDIKDDTHNQQKCDDENTGNKVEENQSDENNDAKN